MYIIKSFYRMLDGKSFRKFFQYDAAQDYYYFEYCILFVELSSGDLVFVPDSLYDYFVNNHEIIY